MVPNSLVEEQWLPRPLSDYESSLDAIERLEEDRRRRLRSIATVPARTPIGLCGIEDRGHAGSTSTHSPKPSGGSNAYNRYRHYPSEIVDRNRLATTVGQQPTSTAASLPPLLPPESFVDTITTTTMPRSTAAVATTRRQYRRTTSASSASTVDTSGIVAETTTTRQRQNLTLFMVSTPITSPRIDPRAGGGGYFMSSVGRRSTVRPTVPSLPSSSEDVDESGSGTNSQQHTSLQILTSGVAIMPPTPRGNEEWITPPAMINVDQTPGVSTGADVYSRRRDASQQRRRRRRGWEEVNS